MQEMKPRLFSRLQSFCEVANLNVVRLIPEVAHESFCEILLPAVVRYKSKPDFGNHVLKKIDVGRCCCCHVNSQQHVRQAPHLLGK